MTTPIEKRNSNKFCEFHGELGHTTNECMHLKRQIEEMLKARKLSHLIKELKQSNGKDQTKAAKNGETSEKDKSLAILMVQPWQRVARKNITQTFSPESVISFPPLEEEDGMEGPMIIEAEMVGHCLHRMVTRVKENPGSSIHGSRNAKIPSDRRNGYITEQQDHSTRMHNGFRTRSATAKEGQKELCGLLRRNLDIFAWKPADMTGVPRHIAEHRLNIREGCLPVRQKKRGRALQGPEINYTPIEKLILVLILADFIVERLEDDPLDTIIEDKEELPDLWILFTDISSCIDGSGAGLIITNMEGMEFTYALRLRFNATNNEGEYEALIAGLRIAKQIGVKNLQANVDSKLVANQVNGVYVAKEPEELEEKSINEKEVLAVVVEEEGSTWITPIYEYLTEEILPKEKRKARAIRRKADARSLIRECSSCQVHRLMPRNPQQKLTPITSPWPFHKWGIDIVGPFRRVPCVDLVSQEKSYQTTENSSGITHLKIGAKSYVSASASPPLNIRKATTWWKGQTGSSNRETPFSLTYGTKAVIPVEIGMPTMRTAEVDMIKNDEALEINLDLLEEKRDQTAIQEAKCKAKMEKYYNVKVRSTSFRLRDLVYRNNEAIRAEDGGKLGPKLEGPYEVTKVLGKGSYKLRDCNGNALPRTWNVCNLKKCYVHEM
ncbi:reverse transcriptase domain-containing protein [Tanacetum coccineum]|uniref:Reverse transcriptase domain-containing protein n=1 Tax=Tanacetum coccineum TaxID=301880 RepID=A0ABQ4ZWB2_9ASTR